MLNLLRKLWHMLFDDSLDTPVTPDYQAGFRGGQVSNQPVSELQPNAAAELVNCDITQQGRIVTRRGTVQLGGAIGLGSIGGLGYYDSQAQQRLVASTLSVPHYYDGAAWVALGAGGPNNGGRRVRFAQGRALVGGTGYDVLFLVDKSSNLWGWNGTAWTDFGSAAANQPPSAPEYIAWHTNRLCLAGMTAERDAIYFSQFLEGQLWDKANWQLRVGAGEDDYITGLLSWVDYNLAVFKRRSIWVVNTDPTSAVADFSIKAIHRKIGCPNGDTAVQVGSDILFLASDGVRSLKRTIATETQEEVGEALSAPVQDVIDRINWINIGSASATYWNNRYILSIPLDANAAMYCLVYNTLTESWSGTWTGFNALRFSYRHPSGGVPRMCFAKGNTQVWEWLDYQRRDEETAASYMDGASNIPTVITSRGMIFGSDDDKTGLNCEVDFYDCSATDATVATIRDGSIADLATGVNPQTNAYAATPYSLRKAYGTQHLGRFREFQIRVASNAGKLGVRTMSANAFRETMALEV